MALSFLLLFTPDWNRNEGNWMTNPQDRGSAPRSPAPPPPVAIRFRDKSCFSTDLGLWPWLKTMFFFVTQVWWISQGWKSQKMHPGINHAPALCLWSKWALHSCIDLFSAQCSNAEEELAKHPQQSISMNYKSVRLCKLEKKKQTNMVFVSCERFKFLSCIYLFTQLKLRAAPLKLFVNK